MGCIMLYHKLCISLYHKYIHCDYCNIILCKYVVWLCLTYINIIQNYSYVCIRLICVDNANPNDRVWLFLFRFIWIPCGALSTSWPSLDAEMVLVVPLAVRNRSDKTRPHIQTAQFVMPSSCMGQKALKIKRWLQVFILCSCRVAEERAQFIRWFFQKLGNTFECNALQLEDCSLI